MDSTPDIPRTGMSREARQWLASNPPTVRRVVTVQNAAEIRAEIAAGYAAAIAAVRLELQPRETEVEVGGVPCLEVVSGSSRASGDTAVMYCFGGGYTAGSPEEDLVISAVIAAATGARIVAPRYPLAPEHRFPAAPDSALAVYRELLTTHGPKGLAVAGESAGGNLALVSLLRARDEGLAMPSALALLSPWGDATYSGDSQVADRDPTLVMATDRLEPAAADYYGEASPTDPLVSPIFGDFAGFPPTFITSGTRDLLLSDSVRLATAMRADDVEVDLRVWEGMWHVFEFYRELPEARASMQQVASFLSDHF